MTTNEKDPKDHFVQPLRCPRTANGNTKRVLVVYALTPGVHVVHACEYEGHVLGSLLPWAGEGDPRGWESRLGEVIEVPAKVAKEYLERSRKLALRAIDEATTRVTFTADTELQVGYTGTARVMKATFRAGESIAVTDLNPDGPDWCFTYRGGRCAVPRALLTVPS
jgi:hypothetical protein